MNKAAMGYRTAIERMIKHFVPEIKKIISVMEGMPEPNLKTEEARVVQKILDEKINPAVAGHGGHISLIDVKDMYVFKMKLLYFFFKIKIIDAGNNNTKIIM